MGTTGDFCLNLPLYHIFAYNFVARLFADKLLLQKLANSNPN